MRPLRTAAFAFLALTSGCFLFGPDDTGGVGPGYGDDDDDDDDDLVLGGYLFSDVAFDYDDCRIEQTLGFGPTDFEGGEFDIVGVSADYVYIDYGSGDVEYERSGNVLSIEPYVDTIAWSDSSATGLGHAYDCSETITYVESYEILSYAELAYRLDVIFEGDDATECIAANDSAFGTSLPSWPCASAIDGYASRY